MDINTGSGIHYTVYARDHQEALEKAIKWINRGWSFIKSETIDDGVYKIAIHMFKEDITSHL